MKLPLDELRRYVRHCDPALPILDTKDNLYVQLDDVRGNHDTPCVVALHEQILLSDRGNSCQLFTGYPGTGKTTELRRLKRMLEADTDMSTVCVFVDFKEWIDISAPVSLVQILAVIAHAFDREATLLEGGDPEQSPTYLLRFWHFLTENNAEFKNLTFDVYGTKLLFEVKDNGAFRKRVEDTVAMRFRRFVDEAHESIRQSVTRLGTSPARAKRVVLIADGLEKLLPIREEDRERMDASVENLFVSHANLLRLPCHAIYTFPASLLWRTASLGGLYDGQEPFVLPMVKVQEPSGASSELGIEKLVDLIGRRLDLGPVFGDDPSTTLRPLIMASGGYLRDLLRLVRPLLRIGYDYPIKPSDTVHVIDRLAEAYREFVMATDLDLIAHVVRTNDKPRDEMEKKIHFGRLLERHVVLAYRNGLPWYHVHPLVRRDPMVQKHLSAVTL